MSSQNSTIKSLSSKILITFGVFIFAVVVPILEINASHVFNHEWPAHARFHEVWQLSTNMALGVLCLWLVWVQSHIKLASLLVVIVMGGVLVAHILGDLYGGSVISGNISKTVLGLELAAAAAVLSILMAVIAAVWSDKKVT